MNTERNAETERLYNQGIAYMREGQWEQAVEVLSRLRAMSHAYPDVDALIADAQLKSEIDLLGMPAATPPPRRRPARATLWAGLAVIALLGTALAAALVLRPASTDTTVAAQQSFINLTLPTIAPTSTPPPTPLPTLTPLPPATPVVTPSPPPPIPGSIGVRVANGQRLTRTTSNLALILDASGSMLGRIDGQPKTDIARQALTALVQRLPEGTNVALRAYGHRRSDDCSDSQLLQELSPLQRDVLIAQINAVRPVNGGRTPIAVSLEATAAELAGVSDDVLVVLVSDGDETCDGDPVAAAAAIHAANPRFRVSVIGFDIEEREWRQRLEAIAAAGGGTYFNAADATQLADALEQAVALTYRVFDMQGVEMYQGQIGSTTLLPAGVYRVDIGGDAQLTVDAVHVGGGLPTFIELREESGQLRASVVTDDRVAP